LVSLVLDEPESWISLVRGKKSQPCSRFIFSW